MSGSPKYTHAQLRSIELAAERSQRREEAAREAERRREESERQARQRLQAACQETERSSRTLADELAELFAEPLCLYIPAETVLELKRTADTAAAGIAGVATETACRAIERVLKQVRDRVRRHTEQANRLHEQYQRLEGELADYHKQLASVDAGTGRFLPAALVADLEATHLALTARLPSCRTLECLRELGSATSTLSGRIGYALEQASQRHSRWTTMRSEIGGLNRRFGGLVAGELASFVDEEAAEAFRGRLAEVESDLGSARDDTTLVGVHSGIEQTTRELQQLEEAARGARLTAHLAVEERELAGLQGRVEGLDAALSRKFDRTGYDRVATTLDRLRQLLQARDVEAVRKGVAEGRSHLNEHNETVARKHQHWLAEQQEAARSVAGVVEDRKRLADAERTRWVNRELVRVDQRLEQLQDHLHAERFAETLVLARELTEELERLGKIAEACQSTFETASGLRGEVTATQPTKVKTFDERGAGELIRLLDSVNTALESLAHSDGIASARSALAKVRDRLADHRAKVGEEFACWQVEHDKADANLTRATVRFAGLQADSVVNRWKKTEIAALAARLERARTSLEAGRFAEADTAVKGVPNEIERLVAEAQPLELQARLQLRMVDGVCRVMNGMGYHVHGPNAEHTDDPRSALIVQAGRESGERIAVSVEHEGRIEYDVGGALQKRDRDIQTGSLRRAVKTCDEAEQQLNTLHELLLELGIETDGLHWDGKPPDDSTAVDQNQHWRGEAAKKQGV